MKKVRLLLILFVSGLLLFLSACSNDAEIPKLYLELAIIDPTLLQTMWGVYLKNDDIGCETWSEIERILELVVSQWKIEAA